MPGLLLHVGAVMQCTHVAQVTLAPGQTRVLVSGQPVATVSNLLTVAGCPFQVPVGAGTKPQPCVKVQWLLMSSRVLVGGQPALLQPAPGSGSGLCQSAEQIPQGPPVVATLQTRVMGA
jgi:hypothetical protein